MIGKYYLDRLPMDFLVDKYKHDVAWKELVNGSNGGSNSSPPPVPSPDASLTEYTETTPEPELQSPPPVPVAGPNETWDDPEFDEEDRIRAMDEFPDRATGADPHPPEEISVSEIYLHSHASVSYTHLTLPTKRIV